MLSPRSRLIQNIIKHNDKYFVVVQSCWPTGRTPMDILKIKLVLHVLKPVKENTLTMYFLWMRAKLRDYFAALARKDIKHHTSITAIG